MLIFKKLFILFITIVLLTIPYSAYSSCFGDIYPDKIFFINCNNSVCKTHFIVECDIYKERCLPDSILSGEHIPAEWDQMATHLMSSNASGVYMLKMNVNTQKSTTPQLINADNSEEAEIANKNEWEIAEKAYSTEVNAGFSQLMQDEKDSLYLMSALATFILISPLILIVRSQVKKIRSLDTSKRTDRITLLAIIVIVWILLSYTFISSMMMQQSERFCGRSSQYISSNYMDNYLKKISGTHLDDTFILK